MRCPKRSVEKLGNEIFLAVQGAQGNAFISDGVAGLSDTKTLFGVIRGALKATRKSERIVIKFLKKYGEY